MVKEMEENNTQSEEDYVEGCHKENYLVPHVCPVATGNWCRDYVKCRSLEGIRKHGNTETPKGKKNYQ